jgi:hypothetical protein
MILYCTIMSVGRLGPLDSYNGEYHRQNHTQCLPLPCPRTTSDNTSLPSLSLPSLPPASSHPIQSLTNPVLIPLQSHPTSSRSPSDIKRNDPHSTSPIPRFPSNSPVQTSSISS